MTTSLIICTVLVMYSEKIESQISPKLDVVKQWNTFTYNFPWDWPTNDKSLYNVENIVAAGIEIAADRIFITTPSLFSGVPATLSVLQRGNYGDSPVLNAYPDWSHHTSGLKQYNCTDLGLVSVYRMKVDSCNRLWALDSGVSRSFEDFVVTCPPKILIFDLNTDQVVRRIDFPKEVLRGESLFTNIIVDESTSDPQYGCDDAFVYITDTVAPAIVVYDSKADLTWRVSHPTMYPDPDFSDSYINGMKFTLMDGVVGIAHDEESGLVYFQPLATDRLFSVTSKALRAGPIPFGKELPVKLVGKKSSQGLAIATSPSGGSIFYSPFTDTAIATWNPRTNDHRVLAQDQDKIKFVADMKTTNYDPGALYILASNFHRFALKNLDVNEVNARILRLEGVITPSAKLQPYGFISHPQIDTVLPTPFKPSVPISFPNLQGNPAFPNFQNYYQAPKPHPYPYEAVPMIDRTKNNPFFALNAGERPYGLLQPQTQQRMQHNYQRPYYGESYYSKVNPHFNDYNEIRRIPKSLNVTATP